MADCLAQDVESCSAAKVTFLLADTYETQRRKSNAFPLRFFFFADVYRKNRSDRRFILFGVIILRARKKCLHEEDPRIVKSYKNLEIVCEKNKDKTKSIDERLHIRE